MESLRSLKFVQLLPPQARNNGTFSYNDSVDTFGAAEALFLFELGMTEVAVGSGNASTPPFIEEHDVSTGEFSPVTPAAFLTVLGSGEGKKLFGIRVDLRKTHKRWMRVNTPWAGNLTTGANLSILCVLGQIANSTPDADGMGLTRLIEA